MPALGSFFFLIRVCLYIRQDPLLTLNGYLYIDRCSCSCRESQLKEEAFFCFFFFGKKRCCTASLFVAFNAIQFRFAPPVGDGREIVLKKEKSKRRRNTVEVLRTSSLPSASLRGRKRSRGGDGRNRAETIPLHHSLFQLTIAFFPKEKKKAGAVSRFNRIRCARISSTKRTSRGGRLLFFFYLFFKHLAIINKNIDLHSDVHVDVELYLSRAISSLFSPPPHPFRARCPV